MTRKTDKKTPPRVNNRTHILLRYLLMSAMILLFAGAIVYKLFNTTVIHAEDWNRKANEDLQRIDTIQPERGDILASDGSVLVTNLCYYNVRIDFRSEAFNTKMFKDSVDALAAALASNFKGKSADEWKEELWARYNTDPKPRAYKLLSKIDYSQLQKVRTFPFLSQPNRNKSGMTEEPFMKRDCPYGSMARRSIGRVGQTEECKEIHGISGLERALDSLLFGTPGIYKRVPFTKRIGNWTDVPATNGYNVTTTIDITLQDILEHELNAVLDSCDAEWGTAIIMEVATGDIKAICNLEKGSDGSYIEAYNRAVVAYEPGSVVKPISMMFALENGAVSNLNEVIPIGGSYAYGGGKPITDSHYSASLTVKGIIEESSNIGMTKVTVRKFHDNPEGFVKCFEDIGFFEKMNSGIYEEEKPRMTRHPSRVDMSRMCYGYATAIPPLYTLSVYNAIANDGRYVRPRLVKALSRDGVDSILPVTYIRDRICSEENAAKLREMLREVVDKSNGRGTGRSLDNDLVKIAGKTGTCYHIDTITHRYDHSKKRLAFCGFFPYDKPKYSCMVLTFHPRKNWFGAASTSGRVLKNVALKMYSRGMLDDNSDYHAERHHSPARPTLYASDSNNAELLASLGASNKAQRYKSPETPADGQQGPPSVINLGIRDAVARLEEAGYEVRFTGTGRVRSQTLSDDNTTVNLILSNK